MVGREWNRVCATVELVFTCVHGVQLWVFLNKPTLKWEVRRRPVLYASLILYDRGDCGLEAGNTVCFLEVGFNASLSFSLGAKTHPWHSRLKTRPSLTNKIILVHCAISGSSILATGGVERGGIDKSLVLKWEKNVLSLEKIFANKNFILHFLAKL
jgi:hypothetical protein